MEDEKVSTASYLVNKKTQKIVKSIDIAIVVIACFFILYVFIVNEDSVLKIILGCIFVIVTLIYGVILYETRYIPYGKIKIRKLVLLNEQGDEIDEWILEDQTALVIGKSTTTNQVDIDLSGTEYESLISFEHAVLNCISGKWYIEEVDAMNCLGIKHAHKFVKSHVKEGIPYPISSGDILYIANTRMLVK